MPVKAKGREAAPFAGLSSPSEGGRQWRTKRGGYYLDVDKRKALIPQSVGNEHEEGMETLLYARARFTPSQDRLEDPVTRSFETVRLLPKLRKAGLARDLQKIRLSEVPPSTQQITMDSSPADDRYNDARWYLDRSSLLQSAVEPETFVYTDEQYLFNLISSVEQGEMAPEEAARLFEKRFRPKENGGEDDEDEEADTKNSKWADMEIVHPPLSRVRSTKSLQRKWRPMEEGTIPRFIFRWCSDRYVFAERRRKVGGTLLLDMSGSMSWDTKHLEQTVLEAPLALVAGYSGDPPYSAQLFILASKGSSVSRIPEHGEYNMVDGPALRWLATQKHPRVWISDGAVNGRDGLTSPRLTREAQSIVDENGIILVRDLEQALEALKRGRR